MTDSPTSFHSTPPAGLGDDAMRKFFDASAAAREHIANSATASELDSLGDYLLSRSEAMQAVSTMSEPAKNDAIALAREILRKLKVSFGTCTILDGLGLRNAEDGVLFGSIKDVVQIYEQMVAWACGIDASIMSDPSVQAAISAIGKIGYFAKLESERLAKKANLSVLVNRLNEQRAALDAKFSGSQENLGQLLDLIERGMNRVINRVTSVSVSGASVSHAQESLGHFMSAAPTAGLARSLNAELNSNRDALGKRNTEMLMAEEAAHQAEAARVMAQNTARAKRNEKQPAATAPARPAANARQAMQQARAQQRRQQTTVATTNNVRTNNATRMNNLHHMEEEHEHHEHDLKQQLEIQLRQQAQKLAAQRAMAQKMASAVKTANNRNATTPQKPQHTHHHLETHTIPTVDMHKVETHTVDEAANHQPAANAIDPHLLKGINLKGFDMSGVTGAPVATSQAEYRAQLTAADKDPNHAPLPPMHNPANKGLVR